MRSAQCTMGKSIRVCPMLHKCRVLNVWKICKTYVMFLFLFLLYLTKRAAFKAICCQAFLSEVQKELCADSASLPLLMQYRWSCVGSCELCASALSEQHLGKKSR